MEDVIEKYLCIDCMKSKEDICCKEIHKVEEKQEKLTTTACINYKRLIKGNNIINNEIETYKIRSNLY